MLISLSYPFHNNNNTMPSRLTSIEEALERDLANLDQTFGSLSSSGLFHENTDPSLVDSIEIGRGLTHNVKPPAHKSKHKRQSSTSSDFKLPDMTGCSKFLSTPGINNKTKKVFRVPYDERDHAVLDALQTLQAQVDRLEKDRDAAISQSQRLKDRIIAERQGKLTLQQDVDELKINLTKATLEIEQLKNDNKLLSDKLNDNNNETYSQSTCTTTTTSSSDIEQGLNRLRSHQCNICNSSTCKLHERLYSTKQNHEDIARVIKKLQDEFTKDKINYQHELDDYQIGCIKGKSSDWRVQSSSKLEDMFRQIEAKADVICTLNHAQHYHHDDQQDNNDDDDHVRPPQLVFGKHKWLSS